MKSNRSNQPKGLKKIIRDRLILILFGGALFIIFLFSLVQFSINLRIFRERQLELTRSLKHSIMWQIRDADEAVRFLVESSSRQHEAMQSRLFSAYQMHSYFNRLILLDQQGKVLFTEPGSLMLSDYSALLRGGNESDELFSSVSLPYVDQKTGLVTVDFRQVTEAGNFIIGQLDLSFLQDIISGSLEGSVGSRKLVITDSYGNILAHPRAEYVEQQVNIGGTALIDELQTGSEIELGGFYTLFDSAYYTVAATLPGVGWFLIDATPVEAMLFELGRTLAAILGLFAVFILLWSFFVGNFVNRKVVVPLDKFIEVVHNSTAAEHPVSITQRISEYREFAELQAAFNAMAEKVRQRDRDLKKFKMAVQQAGFAIYITDKDGHIEYVNPAFEWTTGYSADEAIGRKPNILNSGEMGQNYYENLWSLILNGEIWEEEIVNRRKDGSLYYGHQTIAPIFNEAGEISNFVALQSDITQRKLNEERIRRSEEKYRLLAENSTDMISKHTPEGGYTYVSPVCKPLLGYEPEELIGTNAYEYFHPDDLERIQHSHSSINAVNNIATVIYRIRRKNGSYTWFETTSRLLLDEETGNAVEIVAISRDVSYRKKIEAQLRQAKEEAEAANQAKSAFIANVSHEIRTPMNAVLGYNQLLASIVFDSQALEYIEAIEKSSHVLLELINDILDLSKIEAGRLSLEYGETNVRHILADIKQIFHLAVEEKGLGVSIEIDDTVPEIVFLDEARLRQILLNIVGNAVKFTDQGEVKIRAYSEPSAADEGKVDLHLHIADTGIGIEPSQLQRVFEAFRQQEGQSNRKYGGTGLGLSISKRLAEAMNGTIDVQSNSGSGSLFMVHFNQVEVVQKHSAAAISQPSSEGPQVALTEPEDIHTIEDPAAFLQSIESEYVSRWDRLRTTMFLDEVHSFAQDLYGLAEQHHANFIQQYAQNLATAAEHFQVDRIERLMEEFSELVSRLKDSV